MEPGLSGPKDRDGNRFFKSTQFLRTNKIFWERWFYSEKKMVDKRLGMFIELKKRLFVKNERKNKNEHFESVQRYERNFLFYFSGLKLNNNRKFFKNLKKTNFYCYCLEKN